MSKILTFNYIRKAIKGDERFDQNIDILEGGEQVAVWLNDGWSWNPLDGNRHVEHFNIGGNGRLVCFDTEAYWKHAVAGIDKEI